MKLINTEIIEENDLQYKVETYDNGAVVKTIYVDPSTIPEPEPQPEPELSETEQAIFETQANTEYLISLSELA